MVVHLRRDLAMAPLWIRAAFRVELVAVSFVVLGLALGLDRLWWVITVVGVVAMTAWAFLGDGHERRSLARRLGWVGDLGVLAVAKAEVDSGLVPDATPDVRELARRYAADERNRLRATPVAAVLFVIPGVIITALTVSDGGDWAPPAFIALGAARFNYQAWVLRPRYRRVQRLLGGTEQDWTHQHASGAPRPGTARHS